MANKLAHFAINADDFERAEQFYSDVFGWVFEAWGPPGFAMLQTAEGEVRGSLQQRRELVDGKPTHGFECTIGVDDVDDVAKKVVAAGGRVVMDKSTIAGVGHLIFFEDSEGNVAGAMQYDPGAE